MALPETSSAALSVIICAALAITVLTAPAAGASATSVKVTAEPDSKQVLPPDQMLDVVAWAASVCTASLVEVQVIPAANVDSVDPCIVVAIILNTP